MQFTGKTVEEAIALGLQELNLTEEQAKITVIEQPVKGLFGKLKIKAVVEIEKKENQQEQVVEFVKQIAKYMNFDVEAEIFEQNENTVINLKSSDSSNIIGYRGEVLDAIQTLAGACMNIGKKDYKKVIVDCENYRNKREETLISLAKRLEQKATEMRREVILEPMSPYERRIIHTALSKSETCTTKSEGKEPNRYIVIVPFDKDEFSKPYDAGRNHSDKNGKDFKKDKNKKGAKGNGFRSRLASTKKSGFSEEKRKAPSGFGTYLGNSLKDK